MRGGQGVTSIDRPRVLAVMSRGPLTLLEAPGGYGKTVACAQLVSSLDVVAARVLPRGPVDLPGLLAALAVGLRRSGLRPLADAVDTDDADLTAKRLVERLAARTGPVLLLVDEVQRVDADGVRWLAALATELPDVTRLVIAGRRLGAVLTEVAQDLGVPVVGMSTLCFDDREITAALWMLSGRQPDPGDVAATATLTGGWPAAVAMVAAGGSGSLPEGGAAAQVLHHLVDQLLARTDAGTRELIQALADVPLLSASVLAAIGGEGSLDRILDAGLPIRFRTDGWGELPDPVRDLLTGSPLATRTSRAVAAVYADAGELAEGVTMLHRAADHVGVVDLLARQRPEALVRAGLPLLEVVLDATAEAALRDHPGLPVSLAQEAEHQPRLRRAFLDLASGVVQEGTSAHRALVVEQAIDSARADDIDGPIIVAEQVLAEASPQEHLTRGRAHLVRALCVLYADTAGSTRVVAAEFDQAAALFRMAGAHRWESFAHMAAGYGCDFIDGAFDAATERLERALALRASADIPRAETLTFVAEVRTHVGRLADADLAIREASAIGHRLGDDRIIAFAAWSAAELACQRRDLQAATAALAEAEAHPGGWFDRLAGIDFLSHAAEILIRLGEVEAGRAALARATARAAGTAREDVPLAARARLEAVWGDLSAAVELLDALDRSPMTFRRDRWLRLLLRAVCAVRSDRPTAAAELWDLARRDAIEQGDPTRPERREPELVAMLEPRGTAVTGPDVRVVVLGGFAVERGGIDVTPAPGRPAMLVKLLAIRSLLTIDEAVDLLWTDIDLATGRARLRNVLSRIRARAGDLVLRSGESLTFAPGVEVDARRVEEEATRVLAASAAERVGLARGALARVTGELLPADAFEGWAAAPRERLRRRHLALLDLVAEEAVRHGELDEACRLLDAAIAVDPLEEVRYARLARALLAQGRRRSARGVIEAAEAVARDLGVEPHDDIRTVLDEVTRSH